MEWRSNRTGISQTGKRKKNTAREKANKSRNIVVAWFSDCSSGGSKGSPKRWAGPPGEMRNEKLFAVVARSAFGSQHAKTISCSDHFSFKFLNTLGGKCSNSYDVATLGMTWPHFVVAGARAGWENINTSPLKQKGWPYSHKPHLKTRRRLARERKTRFSSSSEYGSRKKDSVNGWWILYELWRDKLWKVRLIKKRIHVTTYTHALCCLV